MNVQVEERKIQRVRISRFAYIIIAMFIILVGRLWYLQIALGKELLAESEMNRERLIRVRAPRGTIYDRKNRILATSRPQYVVSAVPEYLKKDIEAEKLLAHILNLTFDELEQILAKPHPVFAPVRVAVDVPLDIVAKVSERTMLLPGVSVDYDQLRYYPDGAAVAHIMGYIGEISDAGLKEFQEKYPNKYRQGDYVGKAGIEYQYEPLLHGEDGGMRIEVDARGRKTRTLGEKKSIPGATIKLSIDRDLQIAAARSMEGKTGAAVAVNPQTGEVLALVCKPDFDPNIFVKKVKVADWNKIILNPKHPLQNRAVKNKYPPGSTFKPITAVSALNYGVATTATTMNCPGSYYFGGHRYGDWKTHGFVDFNKSIAMSCDVYYYEMARRLGINKLAVTGRSFGLSYKTGIDLPSEVAGTMPDEQWKKDHFKRPEAKKWWPGETISHGIGQGYIQTTPLQMALVNAAVANWGVQMKPQMVLEILDPNDKPIHKFKPEILRTVPASQKIWEAVRNAMRQTVIAGTGRVVDVPGIAVAGKTGSAEDPPRPRPHAWFTCFAPLEKPTIAIAVIGENGGHGATGAAPVARAILDVYFGKKKPSEITSNTPVVQGD